MATGGPEIRAFAIIKELDSLSRDDKKFHDLTRELEQLIKDNIHNPAFHLSILPLLQALERRATQEPTRHDALGKIEPDIDLTSDIAKAKLLTKHVRLREKEAIKVLAAKGFTIQGMDKDYYFDDFNVASLHVASALGESDVVEDLVKCGVDINAYNREVTTPLIIAINRSDVGMIQACARNGADVNMAGRRSDGLGERKTPLQHAIDTGQPAVVAAVIQMGANVDDASLQYAIMYGSDNTILELLELNAKTPNVQLFKAAKEGDLNKVQKLVQQGVKLTAVSRDGSTLLHWAAKGNQPAIINYLIANGFDIDAKNGHNQTALEVAKFDRAQNAVDVLQEEYQRRIDLKKAADANNLELQLFTHINDIQMVEDLIAKGVNVNAIDEHGFTPLALAVSSGNLAVIEILLTHGAKVNSIVSNWSNDTALHKAVEEKNIPLIRLLLAHGADILAKNNNEVSPFLLAQDQGDIAIVNLLREENQKRKKSQMPETEMHSPLKKDASLDARLLIAAEEGDAGLVRELLKQGADPYAKGARGNTALHIAAIWDRPTVMEALLKAGINPDVSNRDGETPLYSAVDLGQKHLVQILLHYNANVYVRDILGDTPLKHAEDSDKIYHKGLVKLLREQAAKQDEALSGLSLRDAQLLQAVISGDVASIAPLISSGANRNAISESGLTVLQEAVRCGQIESAKELIRISRGNTVNLLDGSGMKTTALHLAIGNPEMVEALLAGGADVNILDKSGDSPFHMAVRMNQVDTVRRLLERSADLSVVPDMELGFTPQGYDPDARMCTALEFAKLFKYTEIVNLIEAEMQKRMPPPREPVAKQASSLEPEPPSTDKLAILLTVPKKEEHVSPPKPQTPQKATEKRGWFSKWWYGPTDDEKRKAEETRKRQEEHDAEADSAMRDAFGNSDDEPKPPKSKGG